MPRVNIRACKQMYLYTHTHATLTHAHAYTQYLSSKLMQWDLVIIFTFNYEGYVPELSRINSYFYCFNLGHVCSTRIVTISVTVIGIFI